MDKKAFYNLSYGLYLIGSTKEGALNGQIANTVFQISSDPTTVAISINKNNLTHEFIKTSKVFSISILSKAVPLDLIGHFGFKSGRDIDKFQTVEHRLGTTGAPLLSNHTVSIIEAEVLDNIDVATHTIFIGKVISAGVTSGEEPMTYAYYQQIKRGTPPTTSDNTKADIKVANLSEEKSTDVKMKKYVCSLCGYVYDPAKGDPDSGISPGTPFEDIPDDWVCPICGVSKDQFDPVE